MTNSRTLHHGWITDLPVADKHPERLANRTVRARVGLLSHHANRSLDQSDAIPCNRRLIGRMLKESCGEELERVVGAFDELRNDLPKRENTRRESFFMMKSYRRWCRMNRQNVL